MTEPDTAVTSGGAEPPIAADNGLRRSRGYLAVFVGLTTVAVLLLVLGLGLGWRLINTDTAESHREAALQTASQAADNLTSIDYRTADRDLQQVLDGSTAEFAEEFGISGPAFISVVKETQLVSRGEVTSAGVERVDEESARVLVAVKASVSNAAAPQGTPRNYRMGVELVLLDGRWLVSKVEFLL
ncbi:MAG: hypothetical protein ACRDTC_14365 [Pseudonocardiaceae bacterium]